MSQLIRTLNRAHFDVNRNCFVDFAFKPSSTDRAISVFDAACAIGDSGNICAHIKRFYADVSSDPPIFWFFESSDLPNGQTKIVESKSTTGDTCHRNITGLSAGRAKKYFKKVQSEKLFSDDCFQICGSSNLRRLVKADLVA